MRWISALMLIGVLVGGEDQPWTMRPVLPPWPAYSTLHADLRLPTFTTTNTGMLAVAGDDSVALFATVLADLQMRAPGLVVATKPIPGPYGHWHTLIPEHPLLVRSTPLLPAEIRGFESTAGHPPGEMPWAIEAFAMVVHPENPLTRLTLRELDATLSTSRSRGQASALRRWNEVDAAFADVPITVHWHPSSSSAYRLVKDRILLRGEYRTDVTEHATTADLIAALKQDPHGLGIVPLTRLAGSGLRAVSLVDDAGQEIDPQIPDPHTNPLARMLWLVGDPARVFVAAERIVLNHLYSRDGQTALFAADLVALPETWVAACRGMLGFVAQPRRAPLPAWGPPREDLDPGLPPFRAQPLLTARIAVVGSDSMDNLMTFWAERLRQHHPDLSIDISANGPTTAFPALIAGTAQVGPIARPAKEDELDSWRKVKPYPPTEVVIAAETLGLVVPKANLIDRLTLAEVDALFGADRRRGHPPLARWTDLVRPGLALPDEAVVPVVLPLVGQSSSLIRHQVLAGGEFRAEAVVVGSVMHPVVTNPGGIGFVTAWKIISQQSAARVIPVARDAHSPALPHLPCDPTAYPLSRLWFVYLDLPPGKKIDPVIAEFLRFALSREGQEQVQRQLGVPLPESWCAAQREWLGL